MNFDNSNELFLLGEIVKKNFSAKYKDSTLGILWTVLNPLLMMALFTIMFSTIFGGRIHNYPFYFLCGRCLFTFFSGASIVSMHALKGNKNILQRTPAPKYIFVLGGIISEFLNFIISLILLVGVMIITHAPFYWNTIPFSIIPVISLSIMVTGLGFMLSIVCVFYSDVIHLWNVISTMVMYASAVFYPMDIIPEPYHQFLILNPMFWVIDQFRCFVYLGVFPDGGNMINSILLSLIILVFGIIIFKKYENKVTMKF